MAGVNVTARERAKVESAVQQYLELAQQIEQLKKEQKSLMEAVIEPFARKYEQVFEDGRYELESGYLLYAIGRAKLVTAEGKSVNKEVKKLLVKRLPQDVVKVDIDLKALEEALENGDDLVRSALEEYEVELVRSPSLQVKPYKARKSA